MSFSAQKCLTICVTALAAMMFSSCVHVVDTGPPYHTSAYRSAPVNTGYSYRPAAYGGRPIYRSSSYYDHRGHDNYRSHSSHRHDSERIKLTGGSQRGKPNRPTGYHTRDWYEKKGYDLSQYKHKHEKSGKTHSGSRYKSSSSSSNRSRSKSSSKSKSKKKR